MKQHFFNIAFIFSGLAMAQIQQGETNVNKNTDFKDESVVVERVYEPKVEAAEKIKQIPEIENQTKSKLPVTYGLKDVEAESDFETYTINAEQLPVENKNIYNNYIRGGFGNRFTILSDAYFEKPLENNKSAGASFNYYLSNSNVPNTMTDSDELNLNAEGFFKFNLENAKADIRLGGGIHQLNYYGLNDEAKQNLIIKDVSQSYKNFYIAGSYDMFEHLFFDKVIVKTGYFGDKYDASETTLDLNTAFKNSEIFETGFANDMAIGARANVNINLSNTKFKVINPSSYKIYNVGIAPQLTASNDLLTLYVGTNVQYVNSTYMDVSNAYIFPLADISINAIPAFNLYGGVKGGIEQNRYQTLYNENPFLLPSQTLTPTRNTLDLYAGIRGDVVQNFKYDASVSYQKLKDIPFFAKYLRQVNAKYAQNNSFTTLYDDGIRTVIEGSLIFTGVNHLNLGTTITLQSYDLDVLTEAWDKPFAKASIDANYKFLNAQLMLGGNLFFVGKRKSTTLDANNINATLLPSYDLNPYVDLNLNAHYMFLDQWGAFIELRNILNQNYERFLDYDAQGFTGAGGVIFKF